MNLENFIPGDLYLRSWKKNGRDCFQVVRAERVDTGIASSPYFHVKLLGYLAPWGAFMFSNVRKYEMVLLSFPCSVWRSPTEAEMNQISMELFSKFDGGTKNA